ncbi:hypothetical protein LguiA_005144 [Lonicera macranthoides]
MESMMREIKDSSHLHTSADQGKLCDEFGRKVLASLALMAEALALKEACFLIRVRNIFYAHIYSDCKHLVQLVSSSGDLPCEISAIVNDICYTSLTPSMLFAGMFRGWKIGFLIR